MSVFTDRPVDHDTTGHREQRSAAPIVIGLSVLAAVLGLLVPDRTVGSGMNGMPMTHYMGLLAVRQPWNLLLFMAVPVILAETLAITELVILLRGAATAPWVRGLSRWAGILAGPVMIAITVHLLRHAVVPLTVGGGWRGPADVIAVTSYLLGVVPMVGISLLEAGFLGRADRTRLLHVWFVALFLVVAHVAMIFGMLDPTVTGWHDPAATSTHQMSDGSTMPGMQHGMDQGGMPGMGDSGMPGMAHTGH